MLTRGRICMAVVAALAAAVLAVGAGSSGRAGAVTVQATAPDVVAATNADRAANGLGPVGWHSVLGSYAQSWAEQMAASGVLYHQSLGAVLDAGDFGIVGENIMVAPASYS